MTILSSLLDCEPRRPRAGSADWDSGPPPSRCPGVTRAGCLILVRAVDTKWPHAEAFVGGTRLPGYLDGIDVGTVLVHRAGDSAMPLDERPWQAGRAHLDGVRWEEKTWPVEDFIAFRDHVASLMEFTVPGDERPQSRNLPVASDATSPDRDVAESRTAIPGLRQASQRRSPNGTRREP